MFTQFLAELKTFAEETAHIECALIVGSYARGTQTAASDIDVMLLTTRKAALVANPDFVHCFGVVTKVQTEYYGACTSIRAWYADGPEVEFGLVEPSWIAQPLDAGTQQVLMDGYHVVVDKTGAFAALALPRRLYHVSGTHGLTMLQPKVSSHGKAYVYATRDRITGLLFGARWDDFDLHLSTNADDLPEVSECYPGAFDGVYAGKNCSVYEVHGDTFQSGVTSWEAEWVSEQPVTVLRETVIPDLAAHLAQAEAAGLLIVHRYCDTPEYRQRIARHVVDRLIRSDALNTTDPRLRKHYGRLIDALRDVMDGRLL